MYCTKNHGAVKRRAVTGFRLCAYCLGKDWKNYFLTGGSKSWLS